MAASRKAIRKTEEIERQHNAAASEAAALGTTAATMLLGILAGTAEARHQPTPQQAPRHDDGAGPHQHDAPPPSPASHNDDAPASPSAASQIDSGAIHVQAVAQTQADSHLAAASADHEAAGAAPLDTPHASAAVSSHAVTDGHGSAAPPQESVATPDHSLSLTFESGFSLTATLDASLGALSNTFSALNADLQHLTGTLGAVTDTITATASNLTQSILSVPEAAAGNLVGAVFDPGHGGHAPLVDASGLVPIANALAPLTIGFAGQPQPDGHDTQHDGAFSALGLHHF